MKRIKQISSRLMIGVLVGAFVGALEIWFYEFSLRRLMAASISGAMFFALLGFASPWIRRNMLNMWITVVGAGIMSAVVWWLVAKPNVSLFVSITIGGCLAVLLLVPELLFKTKLHH